MKSLKIQAADLLTGSLVQEVTGWLQTELTAVKPDQRNSSNDTNPL